MIDLVSWSAEVFVLLILMLLLTVGRRIRRAVGELRKHFDRANTGKHRSRLRSPSFADKFDCKPPKLTDHLVNGFRHAPAA